MTVIAIILRMHHAVVVVLSLIAVILQYLSDRKQKNTIISRQLCTLNITRIRFT